MRQQARQFALDLRPGEHVAALHPAEQPGWAVIAKDGRRWQERALTTQQLLEIAPGLSGQPDVFLSVNRFWGQRRLVIRLRALGACYADLDTYRVPGYEHTPAAEVRTAALLLLTEAKIPGPSLVLSTGRGLALLWLHTPAPQPALPRWQACQERIHQVLRPLGADARAIDSARVLRLAGTINTKSGGRPVEIIDGPREAWHYEDLWREILPRTREELALVRGLSPARTRRERRNQLPASPRTKCTMGQTLVADIEALLLHRYGVPARQIPPGERNAYMFPLAIALALMVPADAIARELAGWAAEWTSWRLREARKCGAAAIRRALEASKPGAATDRRYTPSPKWFIRSLEVTEDEMRAAGLRFIVSPSVRRERRATLERASARHGKRRRGRQSRAEYLAAVREASAERCARAKELR